MSFYETVEQVFSDWNYGHPRIIHALLRSLKPDVHVDCGTYRGLSACWAAKAMQENNKGRVVCLDDWSLREHVDRYGDDPRAHAEANMRTCGVREWIDIVQGRTDEVEWPEVVSSIYIDAFHSYECAKFEFMKAVERGAYLIALDDTENCVGPRMLVEELRRLTFIGAHEWDVMDIHSDNGLTIFLRKQPLRPITFSQELPYPNPGVDLRPMTLAEQTEHFAEASKVTGLNYSQAMEETEHA